MSTIYLPSNDIPEGYGAFSGNQDHPEEKTCKKCLEVDSECNCAYYDELEAEELKAIEEDKKHVLINN
jgi:hypothetical protein